VKHVIFKINCTLFLHAMEIPTICLSATLRKTYNICKHVIDIRLRFRPDIPLNLLQNFGFGRSCKFYIRSTSM